MTIKIENEMGFFFETFNQNSKIVKYLIITDCAEEICKIDISDINNVGELFEFILNISDKMEVDK